MSNLGPSIKLLIWREKTQRQTVRREPMRRGRAGRRSWVWSGHRSGVGEHGPRARGGFRHLRARQQGDGHGRSVHGAGGRSVGAVLQPGRPRLLRQAGVLGGHDADPQHQCEVRRCRHLPRRGRQGGAEGDDVLPLAPLLRRSRSTRPGSSASASIRRSVSPPNGRTSTLPRSLHQLPRRAAHLRPQSDDRLAGDADLRHRHRRHRALLRPDAAPAGARRSTRTRCARPTSPTSPSTATWTPATASPSAYCRR